MPAGDTNKMKYFIVLFIMLITSSVNAQPKHTTRWIKGVNMKTVNQWSSSLNKISNIGSTTYIEKKVGGKDRLHRNKHRDR